MANNVDVEILESKEKLEIRNNHPAYPYHPKPSKQPTRDNQPRRTFNHPYLPKRNYPVEEPGKAELKNN
jgi:hypothetical protein